MNQNNSYFPLFVSLDHKKIVVVGGGEIATRRVRVLLEFSCKITVVAIKASEQIESLSNEERLVLKNRSFKPEDIKNAYFVIAATDDSKVNDFIYECCKQEKCMVNHVGDRAKSDFYFPGIVKEDNLVIGVTASGCDHSLAKEATEFLKKAWMGRGKNDMERNRRWEECCKDQED